MIHITKIHKQRKSTTEPAFVAVLALAGPRRQESLPPCAWPRAAVAARQAPARAGLGGCCWSALGGLRLATHGGPPACTRPRRRARQPAPVRAVPRRPAAAAARRPACAAACAPAVAGRPAPVRRLASPCPHRGGAHRRERVGGVRAGGEEVHWEEMPREEERDKGW